MRAAKLFFIALLVGVVSTGCGVFQPATSNINNLQTNVTLDDADYTVVKRVSGTATGRYILGFGGLRKKALIEEAKSNMLQEAGLEGGARAVINTTVEYKANFFGVMTKLHVTASGYLVEFNG